jgi:RNA polymerase subunit RPABC4/transcription elongation factor Spt4
MWETIKNDPILKTVTIIILSILGFGFAFNIMFGSNNSEMGEMSSGGYSLGNTLSTIFILAIKVLLIVLVVTAIIAVIRLTRNYLADGGEIKMFESIKKDPVLKGITMVGLAIVALVLIYYLFSSMFGLGNSSGMMAGNNGYVMMSATGNSYGISDLFVVLLKIFLVAAVIGLVVGLIMFIKQSYGNEIIQRVSSVKNINKSSVTCPHCGTQTSENYKFCPQCGEKVKEECASCGTELNKEWKCCPACGSDKGEVK